MLSQSLIRQLQCNVALKEWGATCRALELGRQIILLRKGGLLDPEGVFSLEYSTFWLAPTRWHQDAQLLKPQHQELLQSPPAEAKGLRLQAVARVEKSWTVRADDAGKLARLNHIWSTRYLDSRWDYQPESPLLCIALRVWLLPKPHSVPLQPEYSGCRSWIEMETALSTEGANPVLSTDDFQKELTAIDAMLSQ